MLHILAPTDFSNNSYNAIYYAARLFADTNSEFHIVHVCGTEGSSDLESSKSESTKNLDALQHRLIRDVGKNNKHSWKKVSLCSDMAKGIADYAKENDMDLTVIGNKAKEEVKDILFGNNAMQLVREIAHCPVLIIPLEIDFKRVDKMAFASNYVRPIHAESVSALQFFSALLDSVIVPMTIEDDKGKDASKQNRADFLEAISESVSKEVKLPVFEGKVNTILEFVDLWSIDMLCMVYYPHHFFLEFIGKGIIKELNTKLKIPFLILPDMSN